MSNHIAVQAREAWIRLANLIPLAQQCLEPRPRPSVTRSKPASRPPIDVDASKLLAEIDLEVGFYVHVLIDEVPNCTAPADIAARILFVADHVGHFIGTEDRGGQDMLNTAQTLASRVLGLSDPEPTPKWVGKCPSCDGSLLAPDVESPAICQACDSVIDVGTWRLGLRAALSKKIVYRREIVTALKTLGIVVTEKAVEHWVAKGKIEPATITPQTFHLIDVIRVAETRRQKESLVA